MPRRSGCPICGAVVSPDHAPFCGAGCRNHDLLRWLDEGYRLPAHSADPMAPDRLDSLGEPR